MSRVTMRLYEKAYALWCGEKFNDKLESQSGSWGFLVSASTFLCYIAPWSWMSSLNTDCKSTYEPSYQLVDPRFPLYSS